MSLWERQTLEPEIVSIATTQMFRIKRVGETYFVEHQRFQDDWHIVAKSTPDHGNESGRDGAHHWLARANSELIQFVQHEERNRQRAGVPNGARARGAGDGHD